MGIWRSTVILLSTLQLVAGLVWLGIGWGHPVGVWCCAMYSGPGILGLFASLGGGLRKAAVWANWAMAIYFWFWIVLYFQALWTPNAPQGTRTFLLTTIIPSAAVFSLAGIALRHLHGEEQRRESQR